MKKITALLVVLTLLIAPVISFGELTSEEKALVRTAVRNMNIKIDKVQEECDEKDEIIENLRAALEEECIEPHGDVVEKLNNVEKRIETLEKKHESN